MTAWTDFVRANINAMPGATPQLRMKACAAAYKGGKQGSGLKRGPSGSYHGEGIKRGRRKDLTGEGFFGDLWNGIKKAVKVVGPIASMIPGPVGMVAKAVTAGSKLLGNGLEAQHMPPRVKKHMRAMVGGSILQSAAQAEKFGYDSVMQALKTMS